MGDGWFDAKRVVQAKGPCFEIGVAEDHGVGGFSDEKASEGYYIVLERDGGKRPVSKDTFEQRYDRMGTEEK